MIGLKQRDTKKLLKVIARNNPDPEKQAEFRKYFGDRTPTPEGFIYTVTKKLKY